MHVSNSTSSVPAVLESKRYTTKRLFLDIMF
jgi:hypothetical protein